MQARDELDHAVRRNRVEQRLHVVEQVKETERPDEEGYGREEGEKRAIGDLLGESHAVVLHESAEAAFERSHPLGRAQLLWRARDVPGGCVSISRGRQSGSGRASLSSVPLPAPEDQPRGGPDAACEQETHSERPDRYRRKIGAQLGADVGRLAGLLAKSVGGSGKLVAFGLDLAADLLECPAVATGHRSSELPLSASLRGSPAREPEATPA